MKKITILFLILFLFSFSALINVQGAESCLTEKECENLRHKINYSLSQDCSFINDSRTNEFNLFLNKCNKISSKEYNNIANCYAVTAYNFHSKKDYYNAAVFFEKYLKIKNSISNFGSIVSDEHEKFILADTYYNLGDYKKAKFYIDGALKNNSNLHFTYYELAGDVYYNLLQKTTATNFYKIALHKLEELYWESKNTRYITEVQRLQIIEYFSNKKMHILKKISKINPSYSAP